jgi:double-strand break repair protein MRE11
VSFEWRYQIDPEQFADSNSAFNHVNYEDENINVAIPVFSIHGNHDDPSGEGHLAALDILQMSGLLNYYGRTPESDNIQVKPVLLQKGSTKLALYGMSNVRDERLFRTFRDGNVKFFQPNLHKDEWFNLASVHQNHHAYTESGYLPESFLPEFLDLIIWGHEHECKIEPETNTERGFKVIQPGSSVATSLCQPETEAKHVTILSITGKEFTHEPIRLKSVRPFVMREVVLQEDRQMRKIGLEGGDNKAAVDRFCMKHVDELIKQANAEWLELQQENDDELDEELVPPLPLIRLRVEYTAPEGGSYIIDNPQRFSARFAEKVANTNDIIQYHRKKAAGLRKPKEAIALPTENAIAQLGMDAIKIDELVKEFLTAQNLTILPQSAFGDAVQQFVQKDDKHAMEEFISTTMGDQVDHLVNNDGDMEDENAIAEMMEELKNKWEQKFEKGDRTTRKRSNRKPKPDGWDSDFDGHWEDDPDSVIRAEQDQDAMDVDVDDDDADSTAPSRTTAARGRGNRARGRGGRTAAAGTTRKTAAATKKPAAKAPAKGRGKKKTAIPSDEEEEEANEVIDLDDDDDDDEEGGLFMTQDSVPPSRAPTKRATAASATSKTTATKKAAPARQTQLSFNSQIPAASSRPSRAAGVRATASSRRLQEPDDDEISDDDAFETPPATSTRRR